MEDPDELFSEGMRQESDQREWGHVMKERAVSKYNALFKCYDKGEMVNGW